MAIRALYSIISDYGADCRAFAGPGQFFGLLLNELGCQLTSLATWSEKTDTVSRSVNFAHDVRKAKFL